MGIGGLKVKKEEGMNGERGLGVMKFIVIYSGFF